MQLKYKILIAAALICATGLLVMTHLAVTPKESTWEDVLAEARIGSYRIIDTKALWEKYQQDRDKILIVDTRQEWEYNVGHIKDAVNFPMEPTWWARWKKRSALEQLLGPDASLVIVFY